MRVGVYVPVEISAMTVLKEIYERTDKKNSRIIDAFVQVLLEDLPPPHVDVPEGGMWASQTLTLDLDRWQKFNRAIAGFDRPRAVLSWAILDPVYSARAIALLTESHSVTVKIPMSVVKERALSLRLKRDDQTIEQLVERLLSEYIAGESSVD